MTDENLYLQYLLSTDRQIIQRVRDLCGITLNLIDRQGSGGEEDYDLGYATAMRDVLKALDGEQ